MSARRNKTQNAHQEAAICFISDNGYILPTMVALTSLLANKEVESKYRIYILAADLSDENMRLFERMSVEGAKIEVVRTSAVELAKFHVYDSKSMCVASPAALLKFSMGELLPSEDKVLYVDGDVVFRTDICELYGIDLGGNMVAAVPDSGKLYSFRPTLFAVTTYFNSGVMLLNLKRMRFEGYAKRLLEEKRKSTDRSLMDQNIFNLVFEGAVMPLPIRYNCLFVNLVRAFAAGKFKFSDVNRMYGTQYGDFQSLFDDAAIIHYSSKDKPWKVCNVPLSEEWEKYYHSSLYAKVPLKRVPSQDAFCGYDFFKESKLIANEIDSDKERKRHPIIVSLTTFPGRIHIVGEAIKSVLSQTVKADKIVLWLAKSQFPNQENDLPVELKSMRPLGLEIRWVDEDFRSHKKYCYAFRQFPEAVIITIDDDLVCAKDMIELLYGSYKRFPRCISALRTHLMRFDRQGKLLPYVRWRQNCIDFVNRPNLALFATTGAGALYPPHIMPDEVCDSEAFMRCCPFADDVWIKVVSAAYGIPVVLPLKRHHQLVQVAESQECALWKENVLGGGNDAQIDAAIQYCEQKLKARNLIEKIRTGDRLAHIQQSELIGHSDFTNEDLQLDPMVSVVIPIYNHAEYVECCLRSVEGQSYHDIEIICIDDGSTDDGIKILDAHKTQDKRIRVFRQVHKGCMAACEAGLKLARGKYISFLDADDYYDRNFIRLLLDRARAVDCDVVVCGYNVYNGEQGRIEHRFFYPKSMLSLGEVVNPEDMDPGFLNDLGAMHWNKLWSRDLLQKTIDRGVPDGVNVTFPLVACALVNAGRISLVNKTLYSTRVQRSRDYFLRDNQDPEAIIIALSALRRMLIDSGEMEKFRLAYLRFAATMLIQSLLRFPEEASFEICFRSLRKQGLSEIGLDVATHEDIGWSQFRQIRAIIEYTSPVQFLLESHYLDVTLRNSLRFNLYRRNCDYQQLKRESVQRLQEFQKFGLEEDNEKDLAAEKISHRYKRLAKAHTAMKRSLSFRMGRLLTWMPRMVRDAVLGRIGKDRKNG